MYKIIITESQFNNIIEDLSESQMDNLNQLYVKKLKNLRHLYDIPVAPEGYVNLYHATQTNAQLEQIKRQGIDPSKSNIQNLDRGVMGLIWATNSDSYGKEQGRPMVVFRVSIEDKRLTHHMFNRPKQVFELTGKVEPEEIILTIPNIYSADVMSWSRADVFINDLFFLKKSEEDLKIVKGDKYDNLFVKDMLNSGIPELVELGEIAYKLI